MEGKTIVRSLLPYDMTFVVPRLDGEGKMIPFTIEEKVTIPAMHKAPKNIAVIENSLYEKISAQPGFKRILEADKMFQLLEDIPQSFLDPTEAIAAERAKQIEVQAVADKAAAENEQLKKELAAMKAKLKENGVK